MVATIIMVGEDIHLVPAIDGWTLDDKQIDIYPRIGDFIALAAISDIPTLRALWLDLYPNIGDGKIFDLPGGFCLVENGRILVELQCCADFSDVATASPRSNRSTRAVFALSRRPRRSLTIRNATRSAGPITAEGRPIQPQCVPPWAVPPCDRGRNRGVCAPTGQRGGIANSKRFGPRGGSSSPGIHPYPP
jgi:hypothetical protein